MATKATNAEIASRKGRLVELLRNNPDATFEDVLRIYPPIAFVRAFGLTVATFPAKMQNPGNIRVAEICKISEGLRVPPKRIFQLVERSLTGQQ